MEQYTFNLVTYIPHVQTVSFEADSLDSALLALDDHVDPFGWSGDQSGVVFDELDYAIEEVFPNEFEDVEDVEVDVEDVEVDVEDVEVDVEDVEESVD